MKAIKLKDGAPELTMNGAVLFNGPYVFKHGITTNVSDTDFNFLMRQNENIFEETEVVSNIPNRKARGKK